MIQNIIIYIILICVVIFIAYKVFRSFKTRGKSLCDDCGGCELKELKKDIEKKSCKNHKPAGISKKSI
ncbi:MAG: hypothetical protein JJE45_07580 [Prolixibacteraceae bacterium]|nr:hypothetical protein [Prolixibacteraceae bacterium]